MIVPLSSNDTCISVSFSIVYDSNLYYSCVCINYTISVHMCMTGYTLCMNAVSIYSTG